MIYVSDIWQFSVTGQIILVLDDGTEHLIDQPGSLVMQKGTIHAWKNPGTTWARWLTVLVDAEPAVVDNKTLQADVVFVDKI